MKKIALFLIFSTITLFLFNIAFAGIFSRTDASVPEKTVAKIAEKAKSAFASETLSRIQKSPTSRVHLIAQVTSFKISKITRDRPADVAGGFYYVEGEITIRLKARDAVIDGQKVWVEKGQVFFHRA